MDSEKIRTKFVCFLHVNKNSRKCLESGKRRLWNFHQNQSIKIGKLCRPVTLAFVEAPTPAPDAIGLKLKPTGSRVLLDNVFESGPISEILKIILLLLLFWWKFHKGPLEGGRRTKIVKWDSTGMQNLCNLYHLF